ncbi:MAG TPA: hypothetical protein VJJ47_03360 [Candidatus Paceibacterota bacterium]
MTDHVRSGPNRKDIATAVRALLEGRQPRTFEIGGFRTYLVRPTSITIERTANGLVVDIDGVANYPATMPGGKALNGMRIRVHDYNPFTRWAPRIEEVLS